MSEASTVSIKQQQLTRGYFTVGSGREVILIMGSCRVCPLVRYFDDWNQQNGNRFTIHSIDPFNWNWDLANNRVDYEAALEAQELNPYLFDMLGTVDIFIHEYYQNGGMFNTNKQAEKNIYQFNFNPKQSFCVPSFNDRFVLVADIVRFDTEIRKKVMQDYNVLGKLSDQTNEEIQALSQRNLDKFFETCKLTDLPEIGTLIKDNYKSNRFWHNYNHVNKLFSYSVLISLFARIGIQFTDGFINYIKESKDIFDNIVTPLTEYDDMQWDEPVKPLRECL